MTSFKKNLVKYYSLTLSRSETGYKLNAALTTTCRASKARHLDVGGTEPRHLIDAAVLKRDM